MVVSLKVAPDPSTVVRNHTAEVDRGNQQHDTNDRHLADAAGRRKRM